MVNLTSKDIKRILMNYFRFKRQCTFVGTEIDLYPASWLSYIEDFVAVNSHGSISCEIKTSFSDFKNDFNKRKHEHQDKVWYNKFYFVAEEELAHKIVEYLKDKEEYKRYGVIAIINNEVKIIRNAKKLNDHQLSKSDYDSLVARQSSELTNKYNEINELNTERERLSNKINELNSNISKFQSLLRSLRRKIRLNVIRKIRKHVQKH